MTATDITGLIERLRAAGALAPESPPEKTLNDGELRGVNCNECGNMGYLLNVVDGICYTRECKCMVQRRALMQARKSGLDETLSAYTFKAYKTPDDRYKKLKEKAVEYVRTGSGKWFYISGNPGSGKTHLCTAICGALLKAGQPIKYVVWREIAQQLKAAINEDSFVEIMDKLKRPAVLYIDDFLKGSVTDADVNRAIEIINARYNMRSKRTIISSEMDIKDIRRIDEATGGRIHERCGGYCFKAPEVNWRN